MRLTCSTWLGPTTNEIVTLNNILKGAYKTMGTLSCVISQVGIKYGSDFSKMSNSTRLVEMVTFVYV